MATNGRFSHSGQSEVSGNGPNGFPMPKNLGIDNKINSLACSEQKLQIWPYIWLISYIWRPNPDFRTCFDDDMDIWSEIWKVRSFSLHFLFWILQRSALLNTFKKLSAKIPKNS